VTTKGYHKPLVVKMRMEDPDVLEGKHVCGIWYFLPTILWHCWLGDRNGIRPE